MSDQSQHARAVTPALLVYDCTSMLLTIIRCPEYGRALISAVISQSLSIQSADGTRKAANRRWHAACTLS